jgi:hypothetical protein
VPQRTPRTPPRFARHWRLRASRRRPPGQRSRRTASPRTPGPPPARWRRGSTGGGLAGAPCAKLRRSKSAKPPLPLWSIEKQDRPPQRPRSGSSACGWTVKPPAIWARSLAGGTPAGITKPVLLPSGARKHLSRGAWATKTPRRSLGPAAAHRRRALSSSRPCQPGGRGEAPQHTTRWIASRSQWLTAQKAGGYGPNVCLVGGGVSTRSAHRSPAGIFPPTPAHTPRWNAVGVSWHSRGMGHRSSPSRPGWPGRTA